MEKQLWMRKGKLYPLSGQGSLKDYQKRYVGLLIWFVLFLWITLENRMASVNYAIVLVEVKVGGGGGGRGRGGSAFMCSSN